MYGDRDILNSALSVQFCWESKTKYKDLFNDWACGEAGKYIL